MKRLKPTSRIIIAIASLSLVATYFLPVWFIYLLAPQYPEGLTMQIWLTRLSGEVEIINGLNHYIGMAKINESMFPEFGFLVYIVAFYIAAGLLVAIAGKRKLLTGYLVLLALGAVAALVDFYQWGYKYGHNLDPAAPIQVPGLYYQPPVVGHKKLLNFDAYSYPDTGGWVVIIAGLVFFAVWFFEWKNARSKTSATATAAHTKKQVASFALLAILFTSSCNTEPSPFQYGLDQCHYCSMTIMEARFGAQVITPKGKIYKFDDAHCLAAFNKESKDVADPKTKTVFVTYTEPQKFVAAEEAFFVVSPGIKSPMNSGAAAFETKEAAADAATRFKGTLLTWNDLLNTL